MGSDAEGAEAPKKAKMGRLPKQTLAEKLVVAQARDIIAKLDDETLVDTEMAALYLHMSERQLEDLRAGEDGPRFEKTIQKDAQRQNQPVRYAMGELRRWRRARTAANSFDAAVKAGLAGWVSERRPFFAELEEAFNAKRRDVLLSGAWDGAEDEREERFAMLLHGQLRVVWMTSMEAASALWASAAAHRAHADRALALLREEAEAIGAAILRTELLGETERGVTFAAPGRKDIDGRRG